MADIELVDLDCVDIVKEVERAFRVRITDDEVSSCSTVGSLFAVLEAKVPTVERGDFPCSAALAFWQIRRALREMTPGKQVTPSTLVGELMPTRRRGRWWRELERSTGLRMPFNKPPGNGPLTKLVTCSAGLIAGGLLLYAGAGPWAIPIGAAVWFGAAVRRRWPDPLGMDVNPTVGDLARVVASLNVGALTERVGAVRAREAWSSLQTVIRNFTAHSGPIDKRTRLRCV